MSKPFITQTRQSGYTVVELLIASVLGLVLLAGIGQLFVGSNQTFRMQRQLADVQDSGRFAVWFLKEELERYGIQVGAGEPPETLSTDFWVDGGDDENDEITVRYEVAGAATDCAGNAVDDVDVDGDGNFEVENRYFVQDGQLQCEGNGGGAAQPLVANVESFQILYGLDANNNGVADQYVTADAVTAPGLVMAVRFSLLIRGEENRSIPSVSREFQVADRLLEYTDQVPRRLFGVTAMLRNRI